MNGAEGPGKRRPIASIDLDKVIHERSRLVILAHLTSSERAEASFTELKEALGFTAGNLSVQLKILQEAGYVNISKRFVDKKPFTGASVTVEGQKALAAYLAELEELVGALKGGASAGAGRPEAAPADGTEGMRSAAEAADDSEEAAHGGIES